MMINLAVKEIEFNGSTLIAVQDDNSEKVYVGVAWVCEGIGLTEKQRDRQVENIQKDIVLKEGTKKLPLKYGGQVRNVQCIELDFLPLWLAKISITPKMQSESPEVVDQLVEYQLKAKEVLANAFVQSVTQVIPKTYKEALISLIESIEKQEQLEQVITEQQPKVESYEHFIDAKNNQTMNDVSKSLGIGQNKLFLFLRNRKVLMENNLPYQKFIDIGYFEVKIYTKQENNSNINAGQTLVTAKGIDYLGKLLRTNEVVKAI
ncbi:antirepressor protein [Psychrobacillus phage Perkons]|nr:antirepressor protein [Psychrobacillus phage Perkons]